MTIIPNDAPIPDFIRPDGRRRIAACGLLPIDEDAMMRAMQGNGTTYASDPVPARVSAYAPKPRPEPDLAGMFVLQISPLVEAISAQIAEQAAALHRQADALLDHGAGIVAAIIDNARFAAEQMTAAKARAEAAAVLHSDLAARSAELSRAKAAEVPADDVGATVDGLTAEQRYARAEALAEAKRQEREAAHRDEDGA